MIKMWSFQKLLVCDMIISIFHQLDDRINTGWERTVHVSRCAALYSGRIFIPLCRELIVFVF